MIDAATAHGLTARAAVHAGEVELQGDEVRGIAVHATARILDVAKPGEVLSLDHRPRPARAAPGSYLPTAASLELRGLDRRRRLAALVR